jgi:hypothetical protein
MRERTTRRRPRGAGDVEIGAPPVDVPTTNVTGVLTDFDGR